MSYDGPSSEFRKSCVYTARRAGWAYQVRGQHEYAQGCSDLCEEFADDPPPLPCMGIILDYDRRITCWGLRRHLENLGYLKPLPPRYLECRS
jgi:hypothetical protein